MRRIGIGIALCFGLLACGGASAPTGYETLSQLEAKSTAKSTGCRERVAPDCKWLTAFWKADYDDAKASCELGNGRRCVQAAETYAELGIPNGYDSFPEYLERIPRDAQGALGLYEKGCAHREAHACDQLARMLIEGYDVAPDFPRAKALVMKGCEIDGDTDCKLPLPFATYESETVEERERRVARYRERRAGIAAAGRKLAAEIAAKASK
jgi:hypothetical protein